MADTNWANGDTIVQTWMQDVNDFVYRTGPTALAFDEYYVGTNSASDATGLQAAWNSAIARGVTLRVKGALLMTSGVTDALQTLTKPSTILFEDGCTVTSTFAGYIITSTSQACRIEGGLFFGPSKLAGSGVFQGRLTYGWIRGIKAFGFDKAIDNTNAVHSRIQDNWLSDNNYGIWNDAISTADITNGLNYSNNWLNGNLVGMYISNAYGVVLDNNLTENNGCSFDLLGVREISGRNNWFESNTNINPLIPGGLGIPYRVGASCTGYFENSHFLNNTVSNTPTIAYTSGSFVDKSLPLFCQVYNTSGLVIPHNTVSLATWDTEVADYVGMHSVSSLTYNFIIPSTGFYAVSVNEGFNSLAGTGASTIAQLNLRLNGTNYRAVLVPVIASQPTQLSLSTTSKFSAGDILSVTVYQNTGLSLTLTGGVSNGMSLSLVSFL